MITNLYNQINIKSEKDIIDTLEFFPEIYYESDLNLKINFINKTGLEKFGITVEDIYEGLRIDELIHTNFKGLFNDYIKKILNKETIEPKEFLFRKKDNNEFWGKINLKPINKNGKYVGIKGLIIDITEKKNFEENLRQLEEKYRFFKDNSNDFITIIDKNYKIKSINEQFENFLGYNKNELLESDVKSLIHLEDLGNIIKFFMEIKEKGKGRIELRVKRKDGTYNWFELSGKIFSDYNDSEDIIVISRDINIKVIRDQKLEESEEFIKIFSEQTLLGIGILQDGSIKYANHALFNIIEYSIEDIRNFKSGEFVKLIHPKDRPFVLEQAFKREIGHKGSIKNFVYRIITKTGKIKWINQYSKLIQFQDKTAYLAVIFDTTESKNAEEILKESEKKYRERTKELEILNEIISLGNESINLQLFLEKILSIIIEKTNQKCGSIYLYNNETKINKLICHQGLPLEFVDRFKELDMTKPPYDKVLFNKEPFFIEDYEKFRPEAVNWGMLSIASIPIFSKEEYVGEFNIASSKAGKFEKNIIEFIQLVVQEIGIIIKKFQYQDDLKESEEKYRLITDNANDLIAVFNEDLIPEYLNLEVHSKKLGYNKEELEQIDLKTIHLDFESIKKNFRRFFEIGEGIFESRIKDNDGNHHWFEINGKTYIDKDGKKKLLTISRDITEKKADKQKLIESEEKFRLIFENSPIGLLHFDKDGVITACNKLICELIGAPKEKVIGLNLMKIVKEERIIRIFNNALSGQLTKFKGDYVSITGGKKSSTRAILSPIFSNNNSVIGCIGIVEDISNQIKAREKLRESEEKYRSLFDDALEMIHIIDEKGNIIDVNTTELNTLKYSKDDLLSKNLIEIIHPDYKENYKETLKIVLRGEEIKRYETSLITKNGKKVDIEANIVPQKRGDKIIAIRAISRDITERKKAAEILQQNQKWYELLLNSITDGLWVIDKNWEYQFINKSGSNLVNISAKDLLGKKITQVFPGIENTSFFAAYKKSMNDKAVENVSDEFIFPDGKVGSYEVRVYPIPEGIVCIGGDITEKTRIEKELRESQEKYSVLVEQAKDGVIIIQHGLLKFANNALYRISGYIEDELLNSPFLKLDILENIYKISPEDKYQVKENFYPIFESKLVCKDGSIKDIEISLSVIQYHNHPAIMAILRDITWRKQIEKELMEKNKLAAVGQLAAGVAHQLNTPLANISLTNEYVVDLLRKVNFNNSKYSEIKKLLTENVEQVNFCAKIVKELLQFSRRIDIKQKLITPYLIFDEILNSPSIQTKIINNGIIIKNKINKKDKIFGDPILFSQVFQNLINNSIDAIEGIKNTPEIKIISKKLNNIFQIKIIDNGKGISQKDLPRIFEPFYSTKGVGKGTGLGLTICKGIIDKHGGNIRINSAQGQGTEVIIMLPIKSQK